MGMKSAYIQRTILALALISIFTACREEGESDPPGVAARGMMEIEVVEKNGESVDRIGSIRFFVFDNPSSAPVLEINRLYGEGDFNFNQTVGNNEISRLCVTFEVNCRQGSNNNKLVVAVVNEPPSLSDLLDQVALPSDLGGLSLNFAEFLNAGHNNLKDDAALPMTAAVITDKVYPTEQQANNDPVEMYLERSVARVEVYLKRGTDVGADVMLATGTNVVLGNTYDRGCFLYHPLGGGYTLGRIPTIVTGFMSKTWTLATGGADISAKTPLCSFYTPERTCVASDNADKLLLEFNVVTSEGAVRKGVTSIAKASNENQQEKDIDALRRNNIYRITARIDANEITCIVHDWNTEGIETEL